MNPVRPSGKLGPNPRHVGQVALIVAFLVCVYLPTGAMLIAPRRPSMHDAWQASENRPFPRLARQWSSVWAFPRAFGEYFQYNFGLRRDLIRMHTKLVGEALGQSTSQKVMEGKDGWLFLSERGTIEDYRGLLPFTTEELQKWKRGLESRQAWLAEQGIHYLFIVCPDKHSIYPECLPDRINRVHPQTRLDQLVQYLQEHSQVNILDLRPALLEVKQKYLCYQPQETHWNGIGAFAAYRAIIGRLRPWYPDLRALDMNDCEIFQDENLYTDLLRLMGREKFVTLYDCVRPRCGFMAQRQEDADHRGGRLYALTRSTRSQGAIGRLLMLHDSFGAHLIPFLAEHCREALFVWPLDDSFLPRQVEAYRPEIVIEEILERKLCEPKMGKLLDNDLNLEEPSASPADGPSAPGPADGDLPLIE